MSKSNIGYILIIASVIFAGAFYLGRNSVKQEVKGGGERELVLKNRIDSLNTVIDSSEVRVENIYITKTKLKTEYVKDTIWINAAPFDSLKQLFTRTYPRYSTHKQVSDSIYSKRP